MEIEINYYTNVINGKLQKNVSERIANDLKSFEGLRVEITIKKLKEKRSSQQNNLWWLYMNILSKELGYTKNEIHEICKFKFLKMEKIDENTGEVFEYLGSTSKLTKTEFAEIVDELIRWCAESFNITLPLPFEQTKLF